MADIEKNLREIASAKGLRLSDIANRMGTTVSNLLTSVKGNPTVSKLEGLAEALQVGVSELFTGRPEPAQGLVIIDGRTYQISKPASKVLQIPTYNRYDELRGAIRVFIAKAIENREIACMMGILETMELFSLLYDGENEYFHLSLCFADGRMMTFPYDKLEYCEWKKDDSKEESIWDLAQVTEEILNDVEFAVPSALHAVN